MAFFKRKVKGTKGLKAEKIMVATTTMIYYVPIQGPKMVRWYFLVYEVNGKYYDIFSNKLLKKEVDTHHDGYTHKDSETPYIERLKPLTDYFGGSGRKKFDIVDLYDFILEMNVQERLSAFTEVSD